MAGKRCECRHLKTNHTDCTGPCMCTLTAQGEPCPCTVYRDDSGPELCESHGIIKVACQACYEAENPEPVYPLTDTEIRAAVAPIGFEHMQTTRYRAVASAQLKKILTHIGNLDTLTKVVTGEFNRQAEFGCSPSAEDIAIVVNQYLAEGVPPVQAPPKEEFVGQTRD